MRDMQKVECDEKLLSAPVRVKNLSLFIPSLALSGALGCRQQQPLNVLSGKRISLSGNVAIQLTGCRKVI